MARISKTPEARRQELIEAAKALFVERGYERTTVGDIVKRVGVAQGLFYYYFRAKQDIFLAVVDQHIVRSIDEIAFLLKNLEISPLERIRNVLQMLSGSMQEMEVLSPRSREGMAQELYAIMQNHVCEVIEPVISALLKEGSEQGLLYAPYPDRLSRLLISGFIGLLSMSDPPKTEEMMALIVFALEKLLSVPKQALDQGNDPWEERRS